MKMLRIFHYFSYAKWIFLIWAVVLVAQAVLRPDLYALSNTGLAVFLAGLYLGFEGFSNIEKLSKKDIKNFKNPKSMKISVIFLLVVAASVFVIGICFMNVKFMNPSITENIALELKTVGYHCLALGFGFLCYLKLILDKYTYYRSLPEGEQTRDDED